MRAPLVRALAVTGLIITSGGGGLGGEAVDDTIVIIGEHRASHTSTSDSGVQGPDLVDYLRAGLCAVSDGQVQTPEAGVCPEDTAVEPPDCDGQEPVEPLWMRERATEADAWGAWELAAGWTCPEAPAVVLTVSDFRRLPLAPPTLHVQPPGAAVLVNVPVITYAEAPPQTLTTTLLGQDVEVRATATTYTWDYGDGTEPTTTTHPGNPYPDHDVHHTYSSPGDYTITLTATWAGQWRPAGTSTWLPVDGTATTSATHGLGAVEARRTLVADSCTDDTC